MNKRVIIIVSVSVLVLIIILIVVYYMGKRAHKNPIVTKIGSDEAGTTELDQSQIDKLKSLAVAIHNDMDGMNWAGWEDDLYDKMQLLSDTELVAMTNIFNVLYESESGDTFLQWWDSQNWLYEGYQFQTQMADLKKRMVNLGIL